MISDDERIAKALELGWTHLYFASGPSCHPMAAGCRRVESGPRRGDEILVGTPPGQWEDHGDGTGNGVSVLLPDFGQGPMELYETDLIELVMENVMLSVRAARDPEMRPEDRRSFALHVRKLIERDILPKLPTES